jgi:hypothetical protein
MVYAKQQTQSQNKFVLLEASEDDDDEEEWDDEEEEEDDDDDDGTSVSSPQIMQLPGTSANERLATTIDNIVTRFEENAPNHHRVARALLTETPCCPA